MVIFKNFIHKLKRYTTEGLSLEIAGLMLSKRSVGSNLSMHARFTFLVHGRLS